MSVVALASDLIRLADAFSNYIFYCLCVIWSSIVLAYGAFGSSITWVFERLVIPLY